MIGVLLRVYSYLYHLALALLLLGISVAAMSVGSHTLSLGMLPWKGTTLSHYLFGTGVVGLVSIVLAWAGKLRFLLLIYAVGVFGMMARGYFLSGYSFGGKDEFRFAIWLTVGALLAIFGGWSQFRKKSK